MLNICNFKILKKKQIIRFKVYVSRTAKIKFDCVNHVFIMNKNAFNVVFGLGFFVFIFFFFGLIMCREQMNIQ